MSSISVPVPRIQEPASPSLMPIGRQLAFRASAPALLSLSNSNVDPDGQIPFTRGSANTSGHTARHESSPDGDVGLTLSTVQNYVVIISLLPGGSALASGNLKVGDLIASINGLEQNGDLELAQQLLRGPAYSQVQLSLIRFDHYGSALSTEIFLQRLPGAPLSRSISSLVPYSSFGGSSETPRKGGTPLSTSRTSLSASGFRGHNVETLHSARQFGTPRATVSTPADSNVPVEPIPMSATVMNPANNIGFVVKMEHPFYHVLEDIRRKLVPTSMQRSTVLQSVTEMDFRDVFSSEAEAGEQGMSFREYSPRVFAVLRHFWGVDPTDFLDAFANTAVPFRSHTQHTRGFGGLGSVFYCPSGRFVIKFLNQTEFQWLLDFLPSYYNHFYDMHRQGIVSATSVHEMFSITTHLFPFCHQKSFLPKILCVYRIRYNEEQFFVYITNNVIQNLLYILCCLLSPMRVSLQIFWTVDAMDAKFCLKGNSLTALTHAAFCSCDFSGNFPAEEPDPDGTLDIPIDFLVWPNFGGLSVPSHLTLPPL